MTGRHEFVPISTPSQTDIGGNYSYDYQTQLKRHHEDSIAGWNKEPGLHKREKVKSPARSSVREFGHTALNSLHIPRFRH